MTISYIKAVFIFLLFTLTTSCSNSENNLNMNNIVKYSLNITTEDTSKVVNDVALKTKGSMMKYYTDGNKERWEYDYTCCIPNAVMFAERTGRDMITFTRNIDGTTSQISQLDIEGLYQPQIKILNNTEEILGYKCKEAELSEFGFNRAKITINVFYTDKLPRSIWREYKKLEGFPLKMIVRSNNETTTMIAQSISNGSLSDSLFNIPAQIR
jgi:GLPGLI family protein